MLTLAIAILTGVYIFKNWDSITAAKSTFLGVAAAIFAIASLLIPLEGELDAALKNEEILLPLVMEDNSDETFYVSKNQSGVYRYAYDNSEKYGLNGGAYEEERLSGSSVKVYESAECQTPILKVFVTEPRSTWYTFATYWANYEYVFYIPVGTAYYE